MTVFWGVMVYVFAVIGILATAFTIFFVACVLQLRRCSEVGAIDLDDLEGERYE